MVRIRRTLVNSTSCSFTWHNASLFWASSDHNKQNRYSRRFERPSVSFQLSDAVSSIFVIFFALLSCFHPELQTSPAGFRAGGCCHQLWRTTAKNVILLFKTLTIRLKWGLCELLIFSLWRCTVGIQSILDLSDTHTYRNTSLHLMLVFRQSKPLLDFLYYQ